MPIVFALFDTIWHSYSKVWESKRTPLKTNGKTIISALFNLVQVDCRIRHFVSA